MKNAALPLFVTAILTGACFAQAPAATSPEMAAVIANARAYEAAYAKGDVEALAAFFAEDAEYTADDGRSLKGRAAIEESIRAAVRANRGDSLSIRVDAVRVLAPEIVLEKGATMITSKNGETSGALYTAIHAKKDGKWKITELVESPLPVATPHERLSELAWLIGEWTETDEADELTVRSQFAWARAGNFITRNVTVSRSGETVLEGWQIIGWDPVSEGIRSWTFDAEGGFSEGLWTGAEGRWLVRETGYAPDGSRTSADNTFTRVGEDRFTWESGNRTLDGDPRPAIARIEINRVKGG